MSERVSTIVVVIVAVVWALNFTAPIVIHTFHPAPELNVAFMAVIAAAVAARKGEKPEEKAKPTESDEVDVPTK